jgi:hypothetical protein
MFVILGIDGGKVELVVNAQYALICIPKDHIEGL